MLAGEQGCRCLWRECRGLRVGGICDGAMCWQLMLLCCANHSKCQPGGAVTGCGAGVGSTIVSWRVDRGCHGAA